MTRTLTPQQFWSRVDVHLDDFNACWLYRDDAPGYRTPTGHIRISVGGGEHQYAHRFAYAASIGPVDGSQVLHQCDRPTCMAPAHLALGDPGGVRNVAEREYRNRRTPYLLHAPDHHSSRLTQAQADEIRVAHNAGVSVRVLAEEFNVSATTVREIAKNHRYINVVCESAAPRPSLYSHEAGHA